MRALPLLCALLVLGSASRDASAFCRTSTEGLKPGCRPSGTDCCTVGRPIYWRNACIGFSMQRLGTRKLRTISFVEASRTVAQALNVWTSTSCPGGESSSRVSIDVRQLPPVDCGNVETKLDRANQNVIVFRDEVWNHRDEDNVLALTTVSFDKFSGEIRGADLEFNSANIDMRCPTNNNQDESIETSCFDGPPPEGKDTYDFASIITHEAGHFLGLAHSNNPQATMTPQLPSAHPAALRTLTADDIAGICSIYPPNFTRSAGEDGKDSVPMGPCSPTPLNGFTGDCAEKTCFLFCCATSASGPRRAGSALGLFSGAVAIGVLGLRRRTTARRRF
ncbi:MAG: matrixin family metalloprotease [Polyangiaceae bacterium]